MRLVSGSVIAVSIAVSASLALQAQTPKPAAPAQDAGAIAVKNGGITAPGWMGKIDANEEKAGQVLNNSALALEGKVLHVRTGPAVTYWNPANKATGNYTVKATFTEANYMGLNDHPHPYGIVIGGNDMGTDQMSLLYCSAYGDGTYIVRGFGPVAFSLGPRRPAASDAVHKAAGKGSPVTQEIAMSVTADSVSCSINGTVVGTFPKTDVVTAGKLKSTDGVYGIRFAHNTEATVTGLGISK